MTNGKRRRLEKAALRTNGPSGTPSPLGSRADRRHPKKPAA